MSKGGSKVMPFEDKIVPPDAGRMIEGLRDTGYEFETAAADIVDNSVAARARRIDLLVEMDMNGDIRVSFADDGCGMNSEGLLQAMKYGSPARPDPASLGKFGLGLKTASSAFCRRLSVISRASVDEHPVMAVWDLDHVIETNEWNLQFTNDPDPEGLELLAQTASDRAGTVVLWDKVDRLQKDYANPGGAPARKALEQKIERLQEHLSMVYQRFLDPTDERAPNIEITLNGRKLTAWDPFCAGISELVAKEEVDAVRENGEPASFLVRAFILPRKEEYPSREAERTAKLSADRQGMYIYRENRLILAASWLGMFKSEPHGTLLRVEFSFDHKLDEAFHLDIKKSQIILNDELYGWLSRQFLPAPRREANRRYRIGEQARVNEQSVGVHDNSNRNIGNREAVAGGAKVSVINPGSDEVLVENDHGKFHIKLPVSSAGRPGEVFVRPVDSINNGLLFEPAIIDQHRAVQVNRSHPYYHKVYVPNFSRSVTMQGMDSLLWALAVAELTAIRDETADHFKDMRYEVSRILGKLVETLPDPASEEDAA